jgi:hypothetical protein
MKHSAYWFVISLFCLAFFLPAEFSAQCAMCKQSAESTLKSNPRSIARGLNAGILYLMAVPYLAILFIFRKQVGTLLRKISARFSRA